MSKNNNNNNSNTSRQILFNLFCIVSIVLLATVFYFAFMDATNIGIRSQFAVLDIFICAFTGAGVAVVAIYMICNFMDWYERKGEYATT